MKQKLDTFLLVFGTCCCGAFLVSVKADTICSGKSLKYGGGGPAQRDPSAQISTTPYPAYLEESLAEPWCKAAEASELSGSKSAMVWQADKYDDYWVFHGCDGAGLMADCLGGTQYVEHYIRTATKTAPNKCSWGPIDCSVPDNFDACWCPHSESSFVHPGTSNVYKYEAGQYTWCTDKDGKWPDQEAKKPWWDNMGLKDTFDYGCGTNDAITAFVIMYPWVCNDSPGTDLSPLWGDNENFYNGLPYSKKTYQTNCYYDNEPWDILNKQPGYDPHTESSLIPPVWTAYKFVKASEEDQFIRGYKLAWKKSDESTPVTNPNLGKDEGFVLKWKNQNVPY